MLDVTSEDQALLDRYLVGYQRLIAGQIPARTPARRHFIAVARGQALPATPHEWAYVKWALLQRRQEAAAAIPLPPAETALQERPFGLGHRLRQTISGLGVAATESWQWMVSLPKRGSPQASDAYNLLLASDLSVQLDRWFRDQFAGARPSIYDRAMDANYNRTHIGGGDHRLFDGGHDLLGAWQAVAGASPQDGLLQEVSGYMVGLWRDVVTPRGLPLFSMDKGSFDAVSSYVAGVFGIGGPWLKDVLTVNVGELLGSAVATIAVLLNWDKADLDRFASLVGSFGISAVMAANPLLGLLAVASLARAYQRASHGADVAAIASGILRGGSGAGVFILTASLIGGPIWVGLVAGICAKVAVQHAWTHGTQLAAGVEWGRIADAVAGHCRREARETTVELKELAAFRRLVDR